VLDLGVKRAQEDASWEPGRACDLAVAAVEHECNLTRSPLQHLISKLSEHQRRVGFRVMYVITSTPGAASHGARRQRAGIGRDYFLRFRHQDGLRAMLEWRRQQFVCTSASAGVWSPAMTLSCFIRARLLVASGWVGVASWVLGACASHDRAPAIDLTYDNAYPSDDGAGPGEAAAGETSNGATPNSESSGGSGSGGPVVPKGSGPLDPTHVYAYGGTTLQDANCEEVWDTENPDQRLRFNGSNGAFVGALVHPTAGYLIRVGTYFPPRLFVPSVTATCPTASNGIGKIDAGFNSSNVWSHTLLDPDGKAWTEDSADLVSGKYHSEYVGHGGVRLVTNISTWKVWHPDGKLVSLSEDVDDLRAARAMDGHFLVINLTYFETIDYETGEVKTLGKVLGNTQFGCALDGQGRAVCLNGAAIKRYEPDGAGVELAPTDNATFLFSGP
jgi:hypothetical protein